MLRTEELAKARADAAQLLTDTCDIVDASEGWNAPAESVLSQDVAVRLVAGVTPQLTPEGDRLDPNAAATAYLPFGTAVQPSNLLRFPDGSEYRVVGIYPEADEFRFLLKVAVAWAG